MVASSPGKGVTCGPNHPLQEVVLPDVTDGSQTGAEVGAEPLQGDGDAVSDEAFSEEEARSPGQLPVGHPTEHLTTHLINLR